MNAAVESALKVDSRRQIFCSTRELNMCQWQTGPYVQRSGIHAQGRDIA